MNEKKRIRVAAAVVIRDHKVLACRRSYGEYAGWWEFPGGKIEAGENAEEALQREMKEEMQIPVQIHSLLMNVQYDYPEFHLDMDCFLCSLPDEHLVLHAHDALRWLGKDELHTVRWLPADELPLKKLEVLL